jgi:hypothetical protein
MTDVRYGLHAKPLGVSKMLSAHPSQQGSERERTLKKRLEEEEKKTYIYYPNI